MFGLVHTIRRKLSRPAGPLGIALCLLLALPATALADVETVDFDSPPPGLNQPLNESAGHRIKFPMQEGFRPYRAEVPPGRAHSGTTVGDLGRCIQESEASGDGNPESCIGAQARTTVLLTHTAKSVTVFAGRFGPGEPESAVLTAFDVNGNQVATTGALPIAEIFGRTLEVTSAMENIARFRVEARTGPNGEHKEGADLGIDDVKVNFADNGDPDFFLNTTSQVLALVQGQEVDVPVHITRLNGSNGTIELSATNLPTGVSADSVRVEGEGTEATIKLTAGPSAPDTHFEVTEANLTARPIGGAVGPVTRTAPFNVRVAAELELSAGGVSEEENKKALVVAPDCVPVDVPVKIHRDIAMNRDVTLSVRDEESATEMPAGISAEILSSPVVPPGGNLVAERTIRFRADGNSTIGQKPASILLEAKAPNGPPHLIQLSVVHEDAASIATSTPGSGLGFTPRFGKEGSVVQAHGLGFCPGTKVEVGNDHAVVPARMVDDHTIAFNVPRYATTGLVTIMPPGHLPSYKTEDRVLVDSVRNVDGFPFKNYPLGALGIDEFAKAFGEDDVFITVNPCWPFGDCSVQTGFLNPLAALDWGWMNLALRGSGGHCFGMNLALQELKRGWVKHSEVADSGTFQAHSAFELSNREGPGGLLDDYLDAEHAKQYSDEYLSARLIRSPSLSVQLSRLEREFSRGNEPMVFLEKAFLTEHSVVAYDMTQNSESAKIYVYDPQHPFTESEELDSSEHVPAVDLSVIYINKLQNTWAFPVDSAEREWKGPGNNGSLWVVPFDAVPKDPSLPGLSTLQAGAGSLASLAIGSSEGSVRAQPGPAVTPRPALGAASGSFARPGSAAEFIPTNEKPGVPGSDGIWVTRDTKHPLRGVVEGVKPGHYTSAFSAPGFVATASNVATSKGVRDSVVGGDGSIAFEGGRDRPLELQLAQRSSAATTTAATVDTHAYAHGSDTAAITDDGSLTYAHDGAATTVRFSLTAVRRKGGPATFVSPPIAVRPGDRLRVKPMGRELRRVRLQVRSAHGRTRTRVLRSQGGSPGRLRLAAPKISKHRLSMRFKLSGFHGRAVVGAVLRLKRGGHVVARKAISLKAANGARKISWRLPRGVRRGSYRLQADFRAMSTGSRGSTVTGSVVAHRATTVHLKAAGH